ncbi:uncharacterized protein KD926_010354 [Aspergillus affinis]|uniref:uncharacterized protein n=1 Tax=Aspergillus affinis TaxID=1070780 RepID=UPI0022FDF554|nr:uncharacterized protein KD926_010354 [Aspergillus affinis]KAI9045031.1 hypothetical protein KD926_010354 [Aspergillus affinis]
MSPSFQQQYERQALQPFFGLPDPYPWSDMSSPDSSTPPFAGSPFVNFHGSSPDSMFADSALRDWEYATNGCSPLLFPPAVGTPKVASTSQYATAAPGAALGVSGFPRPSSYSAHSSTPSTGWSPPANLCPKESTRRIAKRQTNTVAARRYRQRRLDRLNELETELEAVKREREEWRVKASKLEGETSALKRLLESQTIKKGT